MRALILAPFSDAALERLRARLDITYESWLDRGELYDPSELGLRLRRDECEILVVEADFAVDEVLELPPLRLVCLCRNALNHVDLARATELGIAVVHAPGRNTNAVAELVIGLMIALARRLPQAHQLVAGGGWRDPSLGYASFRGREIGGSTVGVIGFGQIGRAVTRACLALNARVLVHDPLVAAADIHAAGAIAVPLTQLAAQSDFITIHVPDVSHTRGLVDEAFIAQMRPAGYLVNTSAGGVIDTDALVDALRSGRVAGAALDVFDGQPLPVSSPLLTAPNLILTPHIGGATEETIARHSSLIADEIERMLDGRPLEHVVNPDYKLARAR
jgi:phosphoglycerate dehydrogenase-like enzyme